jgi:hypothetical protein
MLLMDSWSGTLNSCPTKSLGRKEANQFRSLLVTLRSFDYSTALETAKHAGDSKCDLGGRFHRIAHQMSFGLNVPKILIDVLSENSSANSVEAQS